MDDYDMPDVEVNDDRVLVTISTDNEPVFLDLDPAQAIVLAGHLSRAANQARRYRSTMPDPEYPSGMRVGSEKDPYP